MQIQMNADGREADGKGSRWKGKQIKRGITTEKTHKTRIERQTDTLIRMRRRENKQSVDEP